MLCGPQRRCYGLVHPAGRKRRDVSSNKGKQKTQFRNKKKQPENRFRDTQWADSLFAATPCFTWDQLLQIPTEQSALIGLLDSGVVKDNQHTFPFREER